MSKTLSGRGESHQNCGVGETPSGNVNCIVFLILRILYQYIRLSLSGVEEYFSFWDRGFGIKNFH